MNYLTNIPWILRIANLMQPHQVVSSLELVLNLGIVGTDAFRPVVEFVVFPGFGIGQSEQIVTVAAER